jgi:opacity protein-like surface antigen
MKKTLLATTSAVALAFAAAAPASAQELGPQWNWYVSLFGGASLSQDLESSYAPYGYAAFTADTQLDTGYILGGAIGAEVFETRFGATRAEIELAFSRFEIDTRTLPPPVVPLSYSGSFDNFTVLANVWQDFETGTNLTPFFGGGVGVAFVDADYNSSVVPVSGVVLFSDGSPTAFAFQLGAGVRYDFTQRASFELSYRLRGTAGFGLDNGLTAAGATAVTGNENYDGLFTHNIVAALTFKFGQYP